MSGSGLNHWTELQVQFSKMLNFGLNFDLVLRSSGLNFGSGPNFGPNETQHPPTHCLPLDSTGVPPESHRTPPDSGGVRWDSGGTPAESDWTKGGRVKYWEHAFHRINKNK